MQTDRISRPIPLALSVLCLTCSIALGQGRQVIGQLTAAKEASQNGITVPGEGTILEGDLITTGAGGQAVAKLSPTNLVTINENTSARFTRVSGRNKVRLEKGTLVAESSAEGSAVIGTPKFDVEPAAAGKAKLYVGLLADNSTYVEALEGDALIKELKSGDSYLLPSGQNTLVPEGVTGIPGLQARKEPPIVAEKKTAPPAKPSVRPKQSSHTGAIVAGVAIAAGAGAAVAAASGKGGSQPASPSAP